MALRGGGNPRRIARIKRAPIRSGKRYKWGRSRRSPRCRSRRRPRRRLSPPAETAPSPPTGPAPTRRNCRDRAQHPQRALQARHQRLERLAQRQPHIRPLAVAQHPLEHCGFPTRPTQPIADPPVSLLGYPLSPHIGDHLGEAGPGWQNRLDLLGRGDQRLDHRLRVAGGNPRIGILHGDADDRFPRQRRRPVSRIPNSTACSAGEAGPGRHDRLCAKTIGCGRPSRPRVILGAASGSSRPGPADASNRRWTPSSGACGRSGRRRIDAHRLASDQTGVGQPLQHPREDRLVRLQVDPPSRSRYRRMVRRRLLQRDVQELPAGSTNRPPATRSPVPSPGPRSSRATASGRSGPAPDSAGPPRWRTTSRTGSRRRRRNPPRRGRDSIVRRTGDLRLAAGRRWPPTSTAAARGGAVCPLPWAGV